MLFIILSAGNAEFRITEFFSLRISQNPGEKRDMVQNKYEGVMIHSIDGAEKASEN